MFSSLILFLKKIYKILTVVIFIVAFFSAYNIFLVDRSVINLKIALIEASEVKTMDDFQKIKALIKVPLIKEITKDTVSSKDFLSLELADNVASSANFIRQAEDLKFYLKNAVQGNEAKRGDFLTLIDRINTKIFKPVLNISKAGLNSKAEALRSKLSSIKNKNQLQQAYYDLGNLYIQLVDYLKAEDAFLKAIEIDSGTEIAVKSKFNLAWVYKTMGQDEKAIKYFEGLSQISLPKDSELLRSSQYQIADTLFKKGDYLKSRDKYVELVNQDPYASASIFGLLEAGNISMYQVNDFASAAKYLEAFYEYRLGQIPAKVEQKQSEQPKSAKTYRSEINSLKPSINNLVKHKVIPMVAKALRERGFILLKDGNYNEAIVCFNKAIGMIPRDGRSYSGLSVAYFLKGDKDAALDNAYKSLELASLDEIVLTNALFVYCRYGLAEKAVKVGENALITNKKVVNLPEFHFNLSYAYIIVLNMDKAVKELRYSIELNPKNPLIKFAFNNLGCAYFLLKDYDKAVKPLEDAIKLDPLYANAHFNLGVVYFSLNRLPNATIEFERTLEIKPDYKEAMDYLEHIRYIEAQSK
ncbi:MAG: tetratricopeptide repeat protein [Candidatus Omnitrophica bacterium]|nr:tetratricopeptide repeat protein [Candidatus Omnitrophota bacterium]